MRGRACSFGHGIRAPGSERGDTFMHIAAGARCLAIMRCSIAILSPIHSPAPWQAHEWLAEVAMAAA